MLVSELADTIDRHATIYFHFIQEKWTANHSIVRLFWKFTRSGSTSIQQHCIYCTHKRQKTDF